MVRVPNPSRRRAAGAVGVVVVFAVVAFVILSPPGGGGDGGDGGPAAETPDVDDADLPPGTNASGVHDADALVAAHRESLVASGFAYRFTHRLTERVENGTTRDGIDVTGNVSSTANLSTVRQHTDRTAPVDERIVSWTNGSASGKRVDANGTSYESYVSSPTWRVTLHYVAINQIAIAKWNLSEVREAEDGTRFVFTANDTVRLEDVAEEGPRNYSASMVVDGQGRIRRFEVNVTTVELENAFDDDEPTVEIVSTRRLVYELTATGNVSVPPPEWLDRVERLVAPENPWARGHPPATVAAAR